MRFGPGSSELVGVLTSPPYSRNDVVLLLHPHPLYGGGMHDSVLLSLESKLIELGIPCFRFGFRGSPTTPEGYRGVAGACVDADFARDFIKYDMPPLRTIGLIGYSFGGAVALRTATTGRLQFVVTLSASESLVSADGFSINELSSVLCPVLMFHGTDDQMVPFSDMDSIASYLEVETKQVALEGENHFYQRSLEAVTTHLEEFLQHIGIL